MHTSSEQLAPVLLHLDREDPGDVAGVYLIGSAVSSGLRPDSDVDLLVLTRRSMRSAERASLVRTLLAVSGWRGHAERFPEAAGRRPVELTGLVIGEQRPVTADPRRDFQYGEWLREEFVDGGLPLPANDPDVVILAATAQAAHRVLRGPALGDLLAPVPREELSRAAIAIIPDVLEEGKGDERNALLTLARILITVETGRIVSKDAAAEAVAVSLAGEERTLMERARAGYLGIAADDWSGSASAARALARSLADRIEEAWTSPAQAARSHPSE